MKRILLTICSVIMVIGLIGCGANETSAVNETTSETQETTQIESKSKKVTQETTTSKFDSLKKYTDGQYIVGKDIIAGEYMLMSTGVSGYFCVSSDANGRNIIFNDNFDTNSIITVNDGEYLKLSRSCAIFLADFYNAGLTIKTSKTGTMLKVGHDIMPGEYKLNAVGNAYYCIYDSSRQDHIVANDNFTGSCYVNIAKGQYLKLSRCSIAE